MGKKRSSSGRRIINGLLTLLAVTSAAVFLNLETVSGNGKTGFLSGWIPLITEE